MPSLTHSPFPWTLGTPIRQNPDFPETWRKCRSWLGSAEQCRIGQCEPCHDHVTIGFSCCTAPIDNVMPRPRGISLVMTKWKGKREAWQSEQIGKTNFDEKGQKGSTATTWLRGGGVFLNPLFLRYLPIYPCTIWVILSQAALQPFLQCDTLAQWKHGKHTRKYFIGWCKNIFDNVESRDRIHNVTP